MPGVGVALKPEDLARIDNELVRLRHIDARASRSSVVRLALDRYFNQAAAPVIRGRTRSKVDEQN